MLSVKILALEIFSFVCSRDSYDSNHSQQEQALRSTLPALCISELVVFFLFAISVIPFLFPPLLFSFSSPSPSCHISEKLAAQAWNWCDEKQLGYLYEPFALPVMATLSPLSVALGFLLRSGAYCKLASSYLRLPAKCIADLTPCQAHPSWNQLHTQLRLKLSFSDACWASLSLFGVFKMLSETYMIH